MTGILGATIGSYPVAGGLTLEFIETDTTSTNTISPSANIAVGDLCVLFYMTYDNDADFVTSGPSDFTEIYNNAYLYAPATYNAVTIEARILTSTSSFSAGTVNGTVDSRAVRTFYFRPSQALSSFTASTVNSQTTASNPSSQTVSASGGNSPLIVFGHASTTGNAAFSTSSPAFDNTYTDSYTLSSITGYKIYNSSPEDHSIDMNDLGSGNRLVSFYLEVA